MKLGWKSRRRCRRQEARRLATCRCSHLPVSFECQGQRQCGQAHLNVTDNPAQRRGREGVARLRQDFHKVLIQIPACKVEAQNCVWQRIALENMHTTKDAVA